MKNLAINLQPLIYRAFPVCRNYTVVAELSDIILQVAASKKAYPDLLGWLIRHQN